MSSAFSQTVAPNSHYASHHSKKTSNSNAKFISQNLNSVHDVMKLTQGGKTEGGREKRTSNLVQSQNFTDGSFLKKLTKNQEMQNAQIVNQHVSNGGQRSQVHSPKHKENQNILNGNNSLESNNGLTASHGYPSTS